MPGRIRTIFLAAALTSAPVTATNAGVLTTRFLPFRHACYEGQSSTVRISAAIMITNDRWGLQWIPDAC